MEAYGLQHRLKASGDWADYPGIFPNKQEVIDTIKAATKKHFPEGNCPFEYRIVTLRPSKMEPIQL